MKLKTKRLIYCHDIYLRKVVKDVYKASLQLNIIFDLGTPYDSVKNKGNLENTIRYAENIP